MSAQYAYTTSRMTFADPQFKKWEAQEDAIDNLVIANFEGLTLVGGNEKKVYVFHRRPNPSASGYILDLAWHGIQEQVWNYMSRHEILVCYESPDQPNSFIIWAKHPILLYHDPDENEYISMEYKKPGICKDMITIIRKHGRMFGIIKDIDKMVYCVEFRIKPRNKHGNLINTATTIIHITQTSEKHQVGIYIKFIYINQTNEFIITKLNASNPGIIHINILSMESTCLDYTREHLELQQMSIPNGYLLLIGSTPDSSVVGRYYEKYYISDSSTAGISNWQQINTIDLIAFSNISPVSSSIWIGSKLSPMDSSITYYLYYYNQATLTLSKFRDTNHKVYIPDDDTLVTGSVVYKRIPLRVLDELPFACPSIAQNITTIIHKFIRAKVIIPQ